MRWWFAAGCKPSRPRTSHRRQLAQLHEEPQALGLSELTPLGRRVLAGWLGLNGPTAARHHGLSGGQDWAGRRRRLLRTLAHTLGTNDVFVAFAVAARQEAARGQDDAFEEWRSASACERRLCKPDGYGRYRRGRATLCFFLEYDRATERAARYAAKFDAYYRYRASRQAARDYAGFPTVLVGDDRRDGRASHRRGCRPRLDAPWRLAARRADHPPRSDHKPARWTARADLAHALGHIG